MGKRLYYSNCFIEAIRAKIKYGNKVKIIHLPAKDNEIYCPHWMWHDLTNDTVCDFHAPPPFYDHWWNFVLFKGYIRVRSYDVWKRWLEK